MVDMQFNDEAAGIINDYRKRHNCDALVIDSALAMSAQAWAQSLAEHSTMRHSDMENYGETLAYKSAYEGPIEFSPSEACHQWYEQSDIHDFDGEFKYETGYFTQMVWIGSQAVGFGRAVSEDGTMAYIVAHYSPKGNVQGEFNTNVPRGPLTTLRTSRHSSSGRSSRHVSDVEPGTGTEAPMVEESEKDKKAREKAEKKEQDRLKKEQKAKEKLDKRKSKGGGGTSDGATSRESIGPDLEETKEQKKAREKDEKERKKREAKEQKEKRKSGVSASAISRESIGPEGEETDAQKKAREKAEKEIKKREEKEQKERAKSMLKEEKEKKKLEAKERKEKGKSKG